MTQTGSRTTVTSKMELFATNFDSFHSLKIVKKISILDVLGVVDPTLITDIFVSQSWILIVWSQFSSYIEIGQSVLMAKK